MPSLLEPVEEWLSPVVQQLIERITMLEDQRDADRVEYVTRIDLAVARERVSREILTKNCVRFEKMCATLHARVTELEEKIRKLNKEEYRDEVHDR